MFVLYLRVCLHVCSTDTFCDILFVRRFYALGFIYDETSMRTLLCHRLSGLFETQL